MNILLVSIAFPPKRDPESLQVAKYCKYLNLSDEVQLQVITSKNPTLNMTVDSTLAHYAHGTKVVKEITIYENRYVNFLIRKLYPNLLRLPDSKFMFQWKIIAATHDISKPDLIYSRSYPMSSTLAALKLKRKWAVPWVLHLSDPWAVATTSSHSPAQLSGSALRWNKRKEVECLSIADRICLTSEKTIELYHEKYPEFSDKYVYMPNVYDDDLVQENKYEFGKKLIFLHSGGFADFRSPLPLLKAIRQFYNDRKVGRLCVEFLFTGEIARSNRRIFEKYADVPIINHLGVISYEQVVKLQRQADVLINVDTDIVEANQAVYFPSKLLDYIIAQRRVISITNPYSTSYGVVQGKLGECFGFAETGLLAQHFNLIYDKHQSGDLPFFSVKMINEEYSARHNATRLVRMFDDLVSRPS